MSQADALMALVDRVLALGPPALTPLGAAILVAHDLGAASDSRGFARAFDLEHALVLRECAVLASDLALITETRRDERTQRQFYQPSATGRDLLTRASV